jgi:class 3 adenylate cyclase
MDQGDWGSEVLIVPTADLTAADFEALGVYDPVDAHADRRLELLDYLVGLGATAEDLVQYQDDLPGAATVVATRGGNALTLSEAAQRAGISEDRLLGIIRAAGFAEPGPDDRVVSEQLAFVAASTVAAEAVFGQAAALQLIRVMGSAMARVADAAVSAFLVNAGPGLRDADPVGLDAARASAEAVALVPMAGAVLETLLRQHIIRARRTSSGAASELGYETRQMSVGFIDLVGSTALAQRLSTSELGAVLTEFEHTATDAITAGGGRAVKLIGDEVMYVAVDEAAALSIALDVIEVVTGHPRLPPVRAGVAAGDVLTRNGDVFGPVVNLAARAVKVAGAGEVVAPVVLASVAGIDADSLGRHRLRGFDDDVELCRLRGRVQAARDSAAPASRSK